MAASHRHPTSVVKATRAAWEHARDGLRAAMQLPHLLHARVHDQTECIRNPLSLEALFSTVPAT